MKVDLTLRGKDTVLKYMTMRVEFEKALDTFIVQTNNHEERTVI